VVDEIDECRLINASGMSTIEACANSIIRVNARGVARVD